MRPWLTLALTLLLAAPALADEPKPAQTAAEVLAASPPGDWRPLDPANTLYMDLPKGRVIIELAPAFAPHHAANIKALVAAHYFDGGFIVRSQDNYVAQWSQPDEKRPMGAAHKTEKAEFDRPIAADLPFTSLPDPDTYAPEVGYSDGFPAARDPKEGRAWLTHCYGMVGAGRDTDADSGGGAELYAVNGHSPRNLDRNVTLVGRVVQGMELLSVLPRGTGDLGFYEKPQERTPITRIRMAADVPAAERADLETLKTDSATFAKLVEARRNRRDAWYKYSSGHVEVCNVRVPTRARVH
jgi:peptidylprolyl isomerase